MVIVDHGGGLFTEYLHLSKIRVKIGQAVHQGQIVGNLGHTGRVTGPVLHYGAVLGNAHVNPLLLSKFPLAVLEVP
jgi:murein DD-endopeptidase MepM/ murein hydrolase activator NlpD